LVRTAGQSLSAAAGGAITGDVSLNNATLALAPASAGTAPFAIGGGFTFADSTLKLGIFAESDGFIAIGGSISISGVNAIDLAPGLIGTFTLGGFGALAGSALTIDGLPQGAGLRQTATTAAIGGDLRIFFDADISRRLAWTGSASAGWNTSDANWIGSNNTNNYASLDTVVFDGAADAASPANRDITLAGNLRVSDMIVSGDADYTFGGAGGITSGTQIITLPGNPENLADVAGKLKKSGAGTLTLANTGTNNFSGGIEISGGVIAFGNAAQIGTADTSGAPVPITFTDAGGTLKKTGAGTIALPAEINIASSATATFDTDGTLTLSAGVGGDGTLEKAGAGMLDLSGSAARAGPVIITAGTLSAGVENLGATPVTNNAALVLRVDADAGFSASMNGAGALFKTGAGALALSGAIALDAVTVSQGSLVITPASQLAVASAFTIAHGAGLRGAGAFSAAQLANAGTVRVGRAADPAAPHGVMTLTGDYTGAGAARISLDMTLNANGAMDYDRFIINGNADGVTTVSLQEHPSPGRLRGDTSLLPSLGEMISVGGSIAAGAFVHDGTVEFGGGQYRWDSTLNGGAGGWRALVIEPVSAIAALDAAGVIIGKASFAAIEQRLLGLRERRADVTDQKQIWVAGFQRGEELGPMRYDRYETTPGFTADTQGIQAGLDWISAPGAANMFVFGLFADYAKSDIHLPDRGTTGSTDSTGGGLHCSWVRGGWHLSALGRHGREGYDATAARRTPTTPSSTHLIATGYSWGGMISTGYDIALGETGAWVLEPSARFTCQTHNIKNRNIYDSAGRAYNVAHTVSSELLAGIRLSREGVWRDTLKCRPYVRAGYIRDFSSDGRVVVDGEEFRHEFGGDGVEIGGGLWLEIFRDTALQAGIEWFDTAVSRGASATFGIAFAW
ncbi:MAG: autotransporter domain-containing protein, partial [Opitutaceae bacterium]|nr:autotransporter domain-containing protein [Opitutaceae bacterium]